MVPPGRVGTVVTGEAVGGSEVGLFGATVCKVGVVVGEELGVSVLGVALAGEAVLGETVVGPAVDGETVVGPAVVGPAVGVALGIAVGVDGLRLGVEVEGLLVGVRLVGVDGVRLGAFVLGAVKGRLINDIVIASYCTMCELLGRQSCGNLGSRMWQEKHHPGIYWRVRSWLAGGTATHRSSCTLRDDRGGMML